MINTSDITGLILAGGAGRRVDGRDKGLLHWRGIPLVEHVSSRLQGQCGEVIISCNRNLAQYRSMGYRTVEDLRGHYQGPLAGLEAASTHIKTDYLAIVACDIPELPFDLVTRLLSALCTTAKTAPVVSFAHDGQRGQYLCAVIKTQCLENLPAFLEQGHRAVRQWYQLLPHVAVDFSDQSDAFRNHNDLTSLQ